MEMYFAVDKLDEYFVNDLFEAFQFAKSNNTNLSMYALIDSSFEYVRPCAARSIWKKNAISIYENTTLDALKDASPYLLKISDVLAEASAQMIDVLETCDGMPMVSFIASELERDVLVEIFRKFLEVKEEDEQKFVLRFADTRCLPTLNSIICEEKVFGWRDGVTHWWLPTRDGKLCSLLNHTCGQGNFNNVESFFSISKKSFDRLISDGESDAIIDAIFDQNKNLLMDKKPSEIYFLINRLLEKIEIFNIKNFSDAVVFCTAALATSECFYLQIDFNKVIASNAWEEGKLGEALFEIDDASWVDAESMKLLPQQHEYFNEVD